MACPTGDPLVDAITGFFDFLDDPIGTIVSGIADAVLSAAVSAFGELTMSIPTLSTTSTTPQKVNDQTQWVVVVYLAVGSLLFAAIRMAFERRGEAGTTALKGLLRVVLVAGAATTVVTAMAKLSDEYADHLFTQATSESLQDIGCQNSDGIEAFLLLILAFLLLIDRRPDGLVHPGPDADGAVTGGAEGRGAGRARLNPFRTASPRGRRSGPRLGR